MVSHCTEQKTDAQGRKCRWIDRKRDHLSALATAPVEARAIVLADKLHNLISIEIALQEGRPVWTAFHAERHEILWYYHAMLDRCDAVAVAVLAAGSRFLRESPCPRHTARPRPRPSWSATSADVADRAVSKRAQRLPRWSCSRSIASNSALKLPLPKPSEPCRSISSKNTVGRSPSGLVKICSR